MNDQTTCNRYLRPWFDQAIVTRAHDDIKGWACKSDTTRSFIQGRLKSHRAPHPPLALGWATAHNSYMPRNTDAGIRSGGKDKHMR